MSSSLTNLARSVAKGRMQKEGIKKMSKHDHGGPAHERYVIGSFFSRNWRKYVTK